MINIDGLMLTSKPRVAIGAAFRGPSGGWLVGFELVTGVADSLKIETQDILKGLKLTWMRGFKQVEVESDNTLFIDIIINGFVANNNTMEVWLVHEWCNREWQVKLQHVLKESNKVVDCLAKAVGGGMNRLVVLVL
ncbi:uncharacterized protein [Gossypium hirsutum]|uniref:RNase H type-1 domain-containing protein n=1 Tax=Gossypium hirsutum TaxID=3635 RepID=A0A1U8NFT2_GOSHI|nr:uncharacterized protein LOC107947879 [Gossypium hirsutum]